MLISVSLGKKETESDAISRQSNYWHVPVFLKGIVYCNKLQGYLLVQMQLKVLRLGLGFELYVWPLATSAYLHQKDKNQQGKLWKPRISVSFTNFQMIDWKSIQSHTCKEKTPKLCRILRGSWYEVTKGLWCSK